MEQDRAPPVLAYHPELACTAFHRPRVELIGAIATDTGLKVECLLDERTYEKGIKVSDAEMQALDFTGDAFHPEWNYTIKPRRCRKT